MTVGTAVVTACSALIAALQADTTLAAAGVNISYDAPILPANLQATDGDYEAIWLGDADETEEIPVLTAGHLHRDETIAQQLIIQVLKPTTDGTQNDSAYDFSAAVHSARLSDVVSGGYGSPMAFMPPLRALLAAYGDDGAALTAALGSAMFSSR